MWSSEKKDSLTFEYDKAELSGLTSSSETRKYLEKAKGR